MIVERKDGLSTGSTLLNLALTENPHVGLVNGKYHFFVGDSHSGKTFFSMACFAEATLRQEFKNHRFIYDNIEDGCEMDLDHLFNEAVADRIEPPAGVADAPLYSDTVESFYYNLDDALYRAGWDSKKRCPSNVKNPQPFIYVLDSMDALDSESADKKFHEQKAAFQKKQARAYGSEAPAGEKEEKVAGSYGDGKAKKNSEFLRKARKGLTRTDSILIILSQTRDDIDSMFSGAKTRAGGRALKYYAALEVWSSVAGAIVKDVGGRERKVGSKIRLQVKKNQITGKLAEVTVDIYPSFGIDDIGSCIDYLVLEKYWTKAEGGTKINAVGLAGGIAATREKLIRVIETDNLEDQVRDLCGKCWAEIQAACALQRKSRYAPPDDADID